MIGYRDMTFCEYWKKCKKGDKCNRALTKDVIYNSKKSPFPIAKYREKPKCFISKKEE